MPGATQAANRHEMKQQMAAKPVTNRDSDMTLVIEKHTCCGVAVVKVRLPTALDGVRNCRNLMPRQPPSTVVAQDIFSLGSSSSKASLTENAGRMETRGIVPQAVCSPCRDPRSFAQLPLPRFA